MKYYDYILKFEQDFETKVEDYKDGLKWTDRVGNTKLISRQAYGYYKRYNINFYEILKIITEDKQNRYTGNFNTARRLVKKLKAQGLIHNTEINHEDN